FGQSLSELSRLMRVWCVYSFVLFAQILPGSPTSPLFPYTTLFRSMFIRRTTAVLDAFDGSGELILVDDGSSDETWQVILAASQADRKSTRLNSSHQIISYAVFCLKKKKITNQQQHQHGRHTHDILV